MTTEIQATLFAIFLLILFVGLIITALFQTGICIPLGQEDNGDGRIETLYLGKCL